MSWNKETARSLIQWGANLPVTATNNDVRNYLTNLIEQVPANDDLFVFDNGSGETVAASLGVTFGEAAATPDVEVVAAKAVLDELELEAGATLAQVHARIGELRTPAGMVAAAAHQAIVAERDELRNRVAELEAKTEEEKLTQLIAANRRKVPPAKEDFVRRIAAKHGLAHATEVVKNMADVLPAEDLAATPPPSAEPAIDTSTIAATRRVRDKDVPVDQESARRAAKVHAIQKENPKLSYREAADELKRREAAGS
jgi:hypothetical protein